MIGGIEGNGLDDLMQLSGFSVVEVRPFAGNSVECCS